MKRPLGALLAMAGALLLPPAPATSAAQARFVAVDVFVDSGGERLAAWQVELTYDRDHVRVLSLEGGAAEGWREPPHYDPRGMTAGRMVMAAFVSDDALASSGRARVARLHLLVEGMGERLPEVRLVTAAGPGGGRIAGGVGVELIPSEGKKEIRQ
jgi:hypothetical protein